mmetsp:Transcript_42111/g.96705  ORF Transcript_42111/g.96705 Transcript_42111/m.96705 type:complete len:88 (+) Transcript_42111:298-561(+)
MHAQPMDVVVKDSAMIQRASGELTGQLSDRYQLFQRSRTIGARQSQIVWFPLMSVHQQAASQPLQPLLRCHANLSTRAESDTRGWRR